MRDDTGKIAAVLLLATLLLTMAGCKKRDRDPYHGIDTIDNVLYGSQPYYALGFSFEKGEPVSTLEFPPPDITIHVNVDINGNITGKYILTPNLTESFALAASLGSAAEASDYFDSLLEVGTPAWLEIAGGVEENQVWLFRTRNDNYVKFRIIELKTDNSQYPPWIEMEFEWRIEPDGSTTFSD